MKRSLLVIIIISVFTGIVMLKPTETAQTKSQINDVQQQEPEDIFQAAKFGNLDKLKTLLAQGVDINSSLDNGTTALMLASHYSHLNIVTFLVEQGADVNLLNENGLNALLAAKNIEIFHYLIAHGADTSVTANNGFNMLMTAAYVGDLSAISSFIEQGADVNQQDSGGYSALHRAIDNQHIDVVKYLVEQGSEVNVKANNDWTPILSAAEGESLDIIKYLVKHGAEINSLSKKGWTPLMIAARYGNLDIIQYLIDNQADIHLTDHKDKWNALTVAVYNNHLDLVKLLQNKGLSISIVTARLNETLLHIAAMSDSLETAKYLIKNGVNVDQKRDWYHDTALHVAAEYGSINMLKYLMEKIQKPTDSVKVELLIRAAAKGQINVVEYLHAKGIDINSLGNIDPYSEGTALTFAAISGHREVVDFLINNGAEVNTQDTDGRTALIYAASVLNPIIEDNIAIIQALVENGADINDSNGQSAFYELSGRNRGVLLKYLIDKGANVNAIEGEYRTPLYNASRNGIRENVNLLLENGAIITPEAIEVAIGHSHFDLAKQLLSQTELDEKALSPLLATALQVTYKDENDNSFDIVKLLIETGANINSLHGGRNETPLMNAAEYQPTHVVKYLVEQGAKIDMTNRFGETALMEAVNAGRVDTIKYLVEQGSPLDTADLSYLLREAAEHGHLDAVKYFVEQGSHIDAAGGILDQTALMYAARKGHLDIVKYLVEQGSDLNATTDTWHYETVLMRAVNSYDSCDNMEVIQYLVESGADITMKDWSQNTVLKTALDEHCIEVFDYLLGVVVSKNQQHAINKEKLFDRIDDDPKKRSEFIKSLERHGITR